ncbi:MAG TPA: DPP IV N-terminal domain-containing protein [Bacteroidales bacterium]|nr:DPP IV N-terminal domain-containing protein [Bacteroidales bacterium]
MKRIFFPVISICLIILSTHSSAQMPRRGAAQASVSGWIDDSHFILKKHDSENRPVTVSYDARTGKSVSIVPEKSPREKLASSLPAGFPLTMADAVSEDFQSAAILRDNDLYYFTAGMKEAKRLTNDNIQEVNARFSPDGKKLAYTKNKDLYVFDIALNKEIRITSDATDRIYNGYSSWVYMEEILGRQSRYAAFWWSPDGSRIAFLRTDETKVPVFTLNRLDQEDGVHGKLEVTPYPKPGDPNPMVKMGIADASSAAVTWVKTDYNVDQYIAWPFWTPDSKKLAMQIVNRDQNDLQIILAEPSTGDFIQIYDEKYKTWLDFHEDIKVLKDGTGFILKTYTKSGFENLYYHAWDGRLVSQLTNFPFRITSIDRVDEDRKVVYFSATGPESTDSHCYMVGLDGKNLVQMTTGPGTHAVSISPKGTYYTDTWSNFADPGSILLFDRKVKQLREVYKFEMPSSPAPKTEMVKIMTFDGLFSMPAAITYPLDFDPSKKHPVIFTIYGGPDSKNVNNSWTGSNPSWYAMNGIVIFRVDHRGSGQFGKRGNDYMYRNLGKWEILDYSDAVKWLRKQSWADSTRIGITGSSYGGYMTCLALTKGAQWWTHGFAGSSVTDWKLYDNVYTERFMDTPEDNPAGYRDGSVLNFVDSYKGKLYFNHGDMDDNVHIQNSIQLISKLEDEGKVFRFMLYPGGRHGWGGPKAIHSRNEEYNFWLENFYGK